MKNYETADCWNKVWSHEAFSIKRQKEFILNELKSLRWKKIENTIVQNKTSFNGLRVIELGSGRGTLSLLMALKGAHITLIDISDIAFKQASILFNEFNCKVDFQKADIFNLPAELFNQFDIAMSFGLGEHFQGTLRQKVFDVHFGVLREGGIVFISVPNRYSLPYRTWKKFLELRHKWIYGFEEPFTRSEITKMAHRARFTLERIIGSGILNDVNQFWFRNLLTRIGINTQIASVLDDYFGYALVFVGRKQPEKKARA